MTGQAFIDTNILVYLASQNTAKAECAEQIVAAGGTISVQVLNEFTHVARRKMQLSWDETHRFLTTFRALLSVVPLSVEMHDSGLTLSERHGFSIYDAMIVAAAIETSCTTLWSEDLQHGMVVEGGLCIRNPFRASDSSPGA